MESADKGFSSTSVKPSATPKRQSSDAGGSNENDQNYQQTGPSSQNLKTPSAKNFMSPTISAASKVVVPRKKILSERNEASGLISSDTQVLKTRNLDSKTPVNMGVIDSDGSRSQVTPFDELLSGDSESDGDEENVFVPNLSSEPYDPLTNYLSPRPKFLRYNPNRRREIFLAQEVKIMGGKDWSSVDRSASLGTEKPIIDYSDISQESLAKQEGEAIDEGYDDGEDDDDDEEEEMEEEEEEEETEEEEEQRSWGFKVVLKNLLWVAILFLSTSYISSMNSPTPSPASQAVESLKDGYQKIQNYIYGASSMKNFEGEIDFLRQREESEIGGFANQHALCEGMVEVEKEGAVENTGGLVVAVELQEGGHEDVSNHEREKKPEEVSDQMAEEEDHELEGIETGGLAEAVELQEGEHEGVCNHEREKPEEVSDQMAEEEDHELEGIETGGLVEAVELQEGEHEDVSNHEREKPEEVSADQMAGEEDHELEGTETEAKSDSLLDHLSSNSEWVDHHHETISYYGSNSNDEVEPFDAISDEGAGKVADDEVDLAVEMDNDNADFNPETRGVMEHVGAAESFTKTVFGISTVSATVLSVALGLYFRHRKTSGKVFSSPIVEPSTETLVAAKSRLVVPIERELNSNKDALVNHSSLVHSMEDAPEESYQSRAPTVELLGEFVIGEEFAISSSLRSCDMKKKVEAEESILSVSQEKSSRSKARLVPVHTQKSPSGFSSMDSYGSLTPQKERVKKEESRDGESPVVATPVRRSSRLRNRAMSP
ncbi:uncharacterized protein LOC131164343 [Malania oleifera]|uniref:uncharacterized protein LOC131164343 n=1 Tax=Malania oleifera TaxID=397392 RepID=UPI0025AE0BAD|nr:uncharacterized protein LOC131164343 [Malania oleifera]